MPALASFTCAFQGTACRVALFVLLLLWSSVASEMGEWWGDTHHEHRGTGARRRTQRYVPRFLETPTNVTFNKGEEAVLPCAIEDLGPKSVIWKRLDQVHPLTIGDYVFSPEESYMIKRPSHHISSPEWNLYIENVQPEHAGTYECQISSKEDISRNVTLNVINKEVEVKTGIQLHGTNFVEKGTSILLNCTATEVGYLPEDVDWFKDGIKVKSRDHHVDITKMTNRERNTLYSQLTIERSTMDDAGTYVCRSSKRHIASIKVIVLNAETINKKRGTFVDGLTKGQPSTFTNHDNGFDNSSSRPALATVLWLFLLTVVVSSLQR